MGICVQMESKWIVLIGPPAVGKTTLSVKLAKELCRSGNIDVKIYSFDQEYPLQQLYGVVRLKSSKDHRKELLERIKTDKSEWIIVDDTCHLKSIQKQYLKESEILTNVKVVFLYISAKIDQIPILIQRNEIRNSKVTSLEIEKMVKLLNLNTLNLPNMIEYNFEEEFPENVETLAKTIKSVFESCYKKRDLVSINCKDGKSDTNFMNILNLALSKEINEAFKLFSLDGKNISKDKKEFIRRHCHLAISETTDDVIKSLVLQFKREFL